MHRLGHTPKNQDELVSFLKGYRVELSSRVESVLRSVDRKHFVDPAFASSPRDVYGDHPLPLGENQTISAPHMHASCLELLAGHLKPGYRALDVGSGSGYLTVCMAKLMEPGGYVLGIEKFRTLADQSITNILKAAPDLLSSGRLKIVHGNALSDALANEQPFNAIHVGAAASVLPQELVDKLQPGGRMIIPIGPPHASIFDPPQVLMCVDKDAGGRIKTQPITEVGYVPLTRPEDDDRAPSGSDVYG